ncbi:MAG: hypothetical protein U0325_00125 [Polyangiales bacterium]
MTLVEVSFAGAVLDDTVWVEVTAPVTAPALDLLGARGSAVRLHQCALTRARWARGLSRPRRVGV